MPFNQTKKYPELLDILSLSEKDRTESLKMIFKRDIEEHKKDNIEIFSVKTRDQKKRQDIIRTYIYDKEQKYVIVLEPQRNQRDYYLLTAYHLNKDYGEKSFNKKLQYKLPDIY